MKASAGTSACCKQAAASSSGCLSPDSSCRCSASWLGRSREGEEFLARSACNRSFCAQSRFAKPLLMHWSLDSSACCSLCSKSNASYFCCRSPTGSWRKDGKDEGGFANTDCARLSAPAQSVAVSMLAINTIDGDAAHFSTLSCMAIRAIQTTLQCG